MASRWSNARLGAYIAAGMIALAGAAVLYRKYGSHPQIEAAPSLKNPPRSVTK